MATFCLDFFYFMASLNFTWIKPANIAYFNDCWARWSTECKWK